jgi:hypothetical protein
MKEAVMTSDDVSVREVSQWAVAHAPCITFGQFRQMAQQRGWSLAWLLEQVHGELDRPTEILRRLLHGAVVHGRQDLMTGVPLPYDCLIRV